GIVNPAEIAAALSELVTAAAARRGHELAVGAEELTIERPRSREHGDWASNAAMQFGKRLGVNPRELAAELAEQLAQTEGIASAEVAGPGFINVRLDAAAAGALAKTIVEQGAAFGRGDLYAEVSINLEFVSANPTGPIHIGGVRWAAVGD